MKITGAIFDMDGTLLNSMDYWAGVAGKYLNLMGITPKNDTNKHFLEDGLRVWYEDCVKDYGLGATLEEARREIYRLINVNYANDIQLKEGARELLDTLYQRGVKMCLATATAREAVEMVLERLDMKKYFSKIFTSDEVGVGKRKPLIYELALEHLGTDRETTYVFEDAVYAMRTAYTNGFKVVGVYDKNEYATEDEIKSLCHIYLDKDSKYRLDIE